MFGDRISAPGKLFLSGEYAVLEGARAVITSVNRRAVATTTRENLHQSRLLREVNRRVQERLEHRAGAAVGRLPNIDIHSAGFSLQQRKLGIGSSAAVSASATGALMHWFGLDLNRERTEILTVAMDAHRIYQDGKGSGADVATSVLGGTLIFQRHQERIPVPPTTLEWVFVWTGISASTVSLVEAVTRFKNSAPADYDRLMTPLITLSDQLATCYQQGSDRDVVEMTDQYGDRMDQLGNAAAVPIVTEGMRRIRELARQFHGGAKPSGAGGGDILLAVFADPEDAARFRSACYQQQLPVLDFRIHVDGLRLEPKEDSTDCS